MFGFNYLLAWSQRYFRLITLFFSVAVLSGCAVESFPYLFRLGYNQARLISQRQRIETYLNNPKSDPKSNVYKRLQWVARIHAFTRRIGLTPGQAYTRYTPLDLRVYVLTAAERTSLRRYQWWWPIVGSLQYKGFFSKEHALREETKLRKELLDTNIRLVRAYSTLGWFDDPVVPGMLEGDLGAFVGVLIHESVHATFFRKGFTAFNEQAAVFVEREGTKMFLKEQFGINSKELRHYGLRLQKGREFLGVLDRLHDDLEAVYSKQIEEPEKLVQRKKIFKRYIGNNPELEKRLKIDQKSIGWLVELNNAYLLSFYLYFKDRGRVKKIFRDIGRDLPNMIALLKCAAQAEENPFKALEKLSKNRQMFSGKKPPRFCPS